MVKANKKWSSGCLHAGCLLCNAWRLLNTVQGILSPMASSFASLTANAKRVIVIDLGFLGDTVHLLPALWVIRQHYAGAELHVMVAEHITGLLGCTPWVDKVWGYPRFPKGPKWHQDLGRVSQLRRAGFEVVINLNGSDRSSYLTFFSGAKWRLGRCVKPSLSKRIFFTHLACVPRDTVLVSEQHCLALQGAGFDCHSPEFHITVPPAAAARIAEVLGGEDGSARRWIHVSPFTTQDYKELPTSILAGALNEVNRQRPEIPVVISCTDNIRERTKLKALLAELSFKPFHVFEGALSLADLVAVIRGSRLHIGGDSGGLHVGVMCGTATLTWVRRYAGAVAWMPVGPEHLALVGDASPTGLTGIQSAELVAGVLALLG